MKFEDIKLKDVSIETLRNYLASVEEKVTNNEKPLFVEGDSYGEALSKLSADERPPTLKELMQLRIKNPELFNKHFDTITALIKKDGSEDDFKIVPYCKELLSLPKDFDNAYLEVDYDSVEGFEVKKDNISDKEFWLYCMGGDTEDNNRLYDDYKKMLLEYNTKLDKNSVMRAWW